MAGAEKRTHGGWDAETARSREHAVPGAAVLSIAAGAVYQVRPLHIELGI